MTAPTQPRQPITMMIVPTAMSRLAADREGRDDDRVAKFPWVTESQTPTPRMPHPPNCSGNTNRCKAISVLAVQSSMIKSKVFKDMLLFSTFFQKNKLKTGWSVHRLTRENQIARS